MLIDRPYNKLLFAILVLLPFYSIGQKQGDNWFFGVNAGLSFGTGSPVIVSGGQTYGVGCPMTCHSEGTAVISDNSGNLLFYTNGEKIWNRNHQVTPNGDSLLGSASSTQSSIIIPRPGSARFFYVFTTDGFFQHNLQHGFRYSVVDICQNGGLGDVLEEEKNVFLLDMVAEKLTAVRHDNGTDYWVLVHKFYSDAFYAYQVSSSGISGPVISNAGSVHPNLPQQIGASIGQLKASPDGQKLALVNGNDNPCIAEYFDFDPASGIVSNPVSVHTPNWMYHGVSFSPDNSKLYIACTINGNGVYQFDLQAGGGNPDSVRASKINVASPAYNYLSLQLANNGKIYATRSPFGGNSLMDVIHDPNEKGTDCNYQASAINISGINVSYGLPNFIDSYDYSNGSEVCINGIAEAVPAKEIVIAPNPFSTETLIRFPHEITNGTLIFYNSLGKQVKQINNLSGTEVMCSRNGLPAGIYFVKLMEAGKSKATVKLTVAD